MFKESYLKLFEAAYGDLMQNNLTIVTSPSAQMKVARAISSINITNSHFTKEEFGRYLSVKHRNFLSNRSFGVVQQNYDSKTFLYMLFNSKDVNNKKYRKNRYLQIYPTVWSAKEFSYEGQKHFMLMNVIENQCHIIKSHLFQRFAERHQNQKMYKNYSVMMLMHYLINIKVNETLKDSVKVYFPPGVLLGEKIGIYAPTFGNEKVEETDVFYLKTFIGKQTLTGKKEQEYKQFVIKHGTIEEYDKKYNKISWLYLDKLMNINKELDK